MDGGKQLFLKCSVLDLMLWCSYFLRHVDIMACTNDRLKRVMNSADIWSSQALKIHPGFFEY